MDPPQDRQNEETKVDVDLAPADAAKSTEFNEGIAQWNSVADKSGFLNDSVTFLEAVQSTPTIDPGHGLQNVTNGTWIGNYQVIEKIGEGGFSRVFAARHRLKPNSTVALKVFRELRLDSWQRLHVETLVLSKFDHPNLVSVLDFGELPDGAHYLVMNRVTGVSLDKYLRQESLDYEELAKLFREIALALQHAHDRDVVHRDLKPTNIMIQPNGHPVVVDFGLAKRLNLSELDQSLTASHAVVGTLGYLAPEQAAAKKQEITRAVDVYGLGATLYFALTGRPPLDRSDFWQAIEDLKHKAPEWPRVYCPEIPRDLEWICLKCLEKSPIDRYPSMLAIAEDLERFVNGRAVFARPANRIQKLSRWCRANPVVSGLSALLLFTLTSGLVSTVYLLRQADWRWRQSQAVLEQAEEILRTGANTSETMLNQTPEALKYRHQHLKDTLAFRQQLYSLFDAEQVDQRPLAVNYFLLGKICCRRGLFEEAHEYYLQALSKFQTLSAADPQDERSKFDIYHTLLGIDQTATTLRLVSYFESPYLESSLDVIDKLVRDYPENVSYRDALACSLMMIGGRFGDRDPSLAMRYGERAHQEAWELRRRLLEPCLEWRHLGTSAYLVAYAHLDQGQVDEAERWAKIARKATLDFLRRPDQDPHDIMDLANCMLLERKIASERRDQATVEALAAEWRQLIQDNANKHPDYFVFADSLAKADEILANSLTSRKE